MHELGGSASIYEIEEKVIADLQLPKEVVEIPHGRGSKTEVEYRLAWARTYLKKFGLIDNSERGVWSLTNEGTKIKGVNPKQVVQFVNRSRRELIVSKDDGTSPEQDINGLAAVEAISETADWREEIIDALLELAPDAFERLLRESGFIEVEVTGRSGDGGIDGRGIVRVAGLISFNVLFQSKRHRGSIGPNIVRDFRGAMIGRADKGLIITTGSFTREAWKEATRDGAPPLDLIDGGLLAEKIKELGLGVITRQVETIEINRQWFEGM